LTGAANKRFTLRIFIRAGSFSDKHDVGVGIADSENRLRSRAGEVRTLRANTDAFPNWGESFEFAAGLNR
jgi:hypothetical protein